MFVVAVTNWQNRVILQLSTFVRFAIAPDKMQNQSRNRVKIFIHRKTLLLEDDVCIGFAYQCVMSTHRAVFICLDSINILKLVLTFLLPLKFYSA